MWCCTMETKFIYVTNMGELYRVTRPTYRKILQGLAQGKDLHTLLAPSNYKGIVHNFTDLSPADAKALLGPEGGNVR